MSAQQSSSKGLPSGDHGDASGGVDFFGDGAHQPMIEGGAAGSHDVGLATTAELANLLANGQWTDGGHGASIDFTDANAYDGHVALALDPGALPDIDSTLDLLTSSHHLFDVPALDVSSVCDDSSST